MKVADMTLTENESQSETGTVWFPKSRQYRNYNYSVTEKGFALYALLVRIGQQIFLKTNAIILLFTQYKIWNRNMK